MSEYIDKRKIQYETITSEYSYGCQSIKELVVVARKESIESMPAINVVRCIDCKYVKHIAGTNHIGCARLFERNEETREIMPIVFIVRSNYYCSFGEVGEQPGITGAVTPKDYAFFVEPETER